MQTFSNLLNYRHRIQKYTFFGWIMTAIWAILIANQTASAQLPTGFDPLEQARVVKRIAIRKIPENGIIRLSEEHCGLGMHVAGVRLVYSRNDHQSLQGQDWNASLSYTLLRPQDKNNSNNTAANVPIGIAHSLAIGEQVTAPYLQTFIAAKTHTIDYSSLNLNYEYNEAELRIRVNNLPILHQNAPQNIWLELELYETSKLPFSPDKKDYHFIARQVGTDIVAAWDYVETAYEYELEWVWIDQFDTDFKDEWTDTPEKIFDYREGVTVQTTDQHFVFPNTFLQGRVFYRVRAIGRFIPEDVPNYGEWNYGYDKVTNTKITTFITLTEDYEKIHNWQSVTSFAENAKYKTVVSYHDGTGRNRQVVTHLSSEKRTLIAETLYDYEGNPTVNILPVSLEGTNLSYHEDLNPFENANPFSKNNYDNGATSTALSTTSGAAQYYSANNTSGGRYAERLPNAQGFAYSRTTYLRDGTGRVREQGGLGATYQVGSEHSTKMYYGSTNDTELKRLFGSNVGKASFYRKQITQDPNGQLSVSYLDAAGQVIATALTGKVPDNVNSLESYEARQIDVDLKDNNIKDELNRRSVSENTIFNNIPGTEYNFTYKVDAKTSGFMGRCLTCQYELSISIHDENGQGVEFIDPTTTQPFATGLFTKTIDPANCSLAQDFEINFTVELPEIGTYQVRKELQVISNEKIEGVVASTISASDLITITTKYEQEALANNPCDICFTCLPTDNPLELFEGMDCESILAQIENAVAEDPATYPTVEDHPEYCHYLACQEFAPSKTFALDMSRVLDWTEAVAKYNLPDIIPPTDERQELEDFIAQDPLFNLSPYSGYIGDLINELLQLKDLNENVLKDANNDPISIWDVIDPTITSTSHPILFNAGENIPFQGVENMNNPEEIAERQWDLFRSNYLHSYEIVKKKILENEVFFDNETCPYLADQEIAIVKDPTVLNDIDNQDDVNDFGNDVTPAPNCNIQVQIWMDQLQNACTSPSVDWTVIQSKLETYCSQIDPKTNPLYILIDTDPIIMQIEETLSISCGTEVESTLATLFQEPGCPIDYRYYNSTDAPSDAVINTSFQMAINKPDFEQKNITIQFNNKGFVGGILKIGDITIKPEYAFSLIGSSAGDIGWGLEIKVKNHVFYRRIVTFLSNHGTPWQDYDKYTQQCFLYTLTIEHTPINATQTERKIRLYVDEFLAQEMVYTVANTDYLTHGNKVIGKAVNFISDPSPRNYIPVVGYNSVWNLRMWEGIRSEDQVAIDAGEVVANPIVNTLTPLAHWTLKGGETQDLTNVVGDPTNNGDVEAIPMILLGNIHPRTLRWKEICCGMAPNPYEPEEISIEQEKRECEKRFKEIAKRDAQIVIDRKRNELRAELIAKYNQDCLDTEETFTYSYTTAEHHYTLYYYDQAGNLVQTVSPEGVDVLTEAEVEDGDDPEHKLKTRYAYNSLNAPIDQETPDAGKSEFFYDKVARIRLSQNAQQETDGFYSYTKYDAQGRITEVGQLEGKQDATSLDIADLELELDNIDFPSQTDYILTQITRTFYDDEATGTPSQITPKNLRGRIAAVKVFEDGQNQGAATFYDYDIHGNVEKLVQSLPELEPKTVEYSYDLLSGNVHRVTYQKGETDQFMHRYTYDADNRLEAVFTSSDGYIWDEDARYLYYAHGPMARVELGEYKVQGVDYYYTLQGWIKGVNLQGDHDAEATNNVQKYVSKDAFGYALHYYQNDYQSINGNFGWNVPNGYAYPDLYNGNIAAMNTTLKTAGQQTMFYQYDQLNRIKEAYSDVSNGNAYEMYYKYDANGNILDLERWNADGARIDKINYTYNITQNNRLQSVNDISNNDEGLERGNHNYTYDEIGNLTSDKDIESIQWTVYGKIAKVKKRDLTEIEYKYDGTGQRIYKKVATTTVTKETHYVRDGSGNVLAIYENKVIDELVIYGSSRLGSYNAKTDQGKRTLGNKKYELSNHLGNVLAVISDNKIGIGTNGVADYYEPLVISESDYYPFGMAMKERSFSNEEYRFGFNGMEKDGDLGEGKTDFGARIYDEILGRFKSVDPRIGELPSISSYAFAINSPFLYIDEYGEHPKVAIIIYDPTDPYEFDDHVTALEKQGYKVIRAASGREAIDAMKTHSSPESPIENLILLSHGSPGGLSNHIGAGIYTDPELYDIAKSDFNKEILAAIDKSLGLDRLNAEEYTGDPDDFTRAVEEAAKITEDLWESDNILAKAYVAGYIVKYKEKSGAVSINDVAENIESGNIEFSSCATTVLGGCNIGGYADPKYKQLIFSKELSVKTKLIIYSSRGFTSPKHNSTYRISFDDYKPKKATWLRTENGTVHELNTEKLNLANPEK